MWVQFQKQFEAAWEGADAPGGEPGPSRESAAPSYGEEENRSAMGRGRDFGGEGEEEAAGSPETIEKMRRVAHQRGGGGGGGLRSPATWAARRVRAPVLRVRRRCLASIE